MPTLLNRVKNTLHRYPHSTSAFVLVLLILSVYCKVRGHEFILNWDDGAYVAENPDICGITANNLKRICTNSYAGNYAPLHLFSYMLEYSIWGLKPDLSVMTNVTLHIGSTLMCCRLLTMLGLTLPQAFIAAALFAIHPVQVESVAWISQRKNVLCMFFFLASWLAWITWKTKETGKSRIYWYGASLAFFTLALLSKSIAVILPLFFIAQELACERKPVTARFLTALIPYAVLTGICVVAALNSQTHDGGGRIAHYGGSLAITMMNMLPVFSRYLTLLIFPAGLSIIYNLPIKSTPDLNIILSGIVFLLFIIGWLRLWKAHRCHFFWLSLFIIGLLPVSNIIPIVTMMNDRYLYFPMLGMAPFAVLSINGALDKFLPRWSAAPVLVATIVILCFCTASRQRLDVWKSQLTIWSDTIVKTDNGAWYALDGNFINYKYADTLVDLAREQNRHDNWSEARRLYYLALAYDRTHYYALMETSLLYLTRKQPMLARPFLVRLLDLYKRSAAGHFLMGASYDLTGETGLAQDEIKKALELDPQHTGAKNALKLLETKMNTKKD